ncbi:MAG: exodeoxyribonuclease VII small subunit [Sciscionella sp.]
MTDDSQRDASSDLDGLGYKAARDELADVVAKLESGGLSLEDSLTLWERGEALAKVCERHLAGARERVAAALSTVDDTGDATGNDSAG